MTPKKNSDLAVLQWCLCVCVCSHRFLEWVCGVVVSAFWQRVVCVMVCVVMWVQSGFSGWCAFACLSAGFCW